MSVYEQGRKQHGRLVVVFARPGAADAPWRLGITATRKVGNAVVRNRLRRRVRECLRRHRPELRGGWDIVVNLKHVAAVADSEALHRDLLQALKRLGLWVPADSSGAAAPVTESRNSEGVSPKDA